MEEKASSHRDLCRCLCVSCRCLCPPLGGWSISRAASGEGWTIPVTNLAGWAGPAPFGCVSGCSEPLFASVSPCSAPLPTCEQRGTSSTRTDRALHSSSCGSAGEVSPKGREGVPKGWEPAACCNSGMSLRKGNSSKSSWLV